MLRSWSVFLIPLLCSLSAFAQAEKYNPYAVQKEDPPISADGKINWPPFFKSAGMESRFQGYFATGSCVGTNMRIVKMLEANKVDVNALPATKVAVRSVAVQGGIIQALDEQGKTVTLVTHPKGVSNIEITGQMLADLVSPGMIVRFNGSVDEHAKGLAPIADLHVISLTSDLKPTTVEANKTQPILGKVERRHHQQIVVNVGVGHLRALTFTLPADAKVYVQGSTLDLVALGDLVEAEGLLYSGQGAGTDQTVFASKVLVKKALPTGVDLAAKK